MDPAQPTPPLKPRHGRPARPWLRFLAGIDAGLFGGLLAVGWLVVHSRLSAEIWWSKLNVAAAPFFGDLAFQLGLSRATAAGAALLLLLAGLLGGLFGLLIPERCGWVRVLLLGLLFAFLCHSAAERWFWPRLHLFSAAYFPRSATLPAHSLFGLGLSRFAQRWDSISKSFSR